ncbi:MAG: dihydropteroate synthase [Myxococcota bacterium]
MAAEETHNSSFIIHNFKIKATRRHPCYPGERMGGTNQTVVCGGRRLALGRRTHVMGVINVTPDSFSDGGLFNSAEAAVAHGVRLLAEGADLLDVGGESTRPGAVPVPPREERARVLPVVEGLVARGVRCISVDTRNASTAAACLGAGASWINDISALRHDPAMARVARKADGVVLMHMRGTPATMQQGEIAYDDVAREVANFLAGRVRVARDAGISPDRILVDPGIGFGKTLEHNLELSRRLDVFRPLAAGIVYGPSRKGFLGKLVEEQDPRQRTAATLGAVAAGALQGADVVRVHDVRATVHLLRVLRSLSPQSLLKVVASEAPARQKSPRKVEFTEVNEHF